MKTFIIAIILAFVVICAAEDNSTTPAIDNNSTTPIASTSLKPTTTPEPVSNSTTPEPASNSTTPEPASNSTTPKASTTPKVTTAPAVTTTPLPPKDSVSVNVTNGNVTCIRLEGQMTITIAESNSSYALNVPKDAAATGNCSYNATIQNLEMTFEKDWKLMFTFSKNSDGDVSISQIDLTYDTSIFGSAAQATKTVSVKGDFLKSSSDGYYVCNANSTLVNQDSVSLTTTNLKYRAFNTDSDPKFDGSVMECSADEDTSSVVPIAVGAALAGLVVIVLIAYLIGRRRSRQTGYESV